MANHPNRAKVEWTQAFPQDMPEGAAFVAISDGDTTFCAPSGRKSLATMIRAYSRTYGFNEPGEVECHAYLYPADWDGTPGEWTEHERFTITHD